MKSLSPFVFLFLLSNLVLAQKVGQVLDSVSNKPIPFVNMHVLGTQTGYTSNHKGQYRINRVQANDSIVLTAIGYKTLSIAAKDISGDILLGPIAYKISEVAIHAEDKTKEIGRVKKQIFSYHHAATKGFAYMIGRFFEYKEEYAETPLIKSIEVLTEAEVDSAQFNLRLYTVDSMGYPTEPIHQANIFVFPAKGTNFTNVNLEKFYLPFPKEGLFVAVEWLQIEQNEYVHEYKDPRTKKQVTEILIEPSFALENNPKKGNIWRYSGRWKKEEGEYSRLLQMKVVLRN